MIHIFYQTRANFQKKSALIVFCLLLLIPLFTRSTDAQSSSPQRYVMRYPDISETAVVFTYGGDIWKVPVNGGTAVRLTIHEGEELFPKFSPDGKLIAFTGEYDGNSDVYVMNTDGGNITRLTYYPGEDEAVGWHPFKNKIIFRSSRESLTRYTRLFMISPDGSGIETLPLHEGAYGSFSPDGEKIAYNRNQTDNRTWKRYRGGLAPDVFIYDFKTREDIKIIDFIGTDRTPMWIGDKIYFCSDRGETLNLFSYDPKTKTVEQLTNHLDYDVIRPSEGGNKIVYELGGTLMALDVVSKQTRLIPVEINTDTPETRPFYKNVQEFITQIDLSPTGNRALMVARGEIFTVPKKNGPTRNLSNTSGSREKDAAWSPDGKNIAYLSDKTGEYEIYIADPLGITPPRQLTQHKDGYRHLLKWSPDSKKIAFADQTLSFYYIDIETKKIVKVDQSKYEYMDVSLHVKPIYDFAWSPDSRFLAYSKMDGDLVNKIYIYSLESGQINCASSGIFNDFNPVFSMDGEYLFFVSNRRFNPTFCDFEWEMVYKDMAGIYSLTLKKDGKPLFPLKSDEEEGKSPPSKEPAAPAKKMKNSIGETPGDKKINVVIDFEGLQYRIESFPLPRGNYRNLSVNNDSLFFFNAEKGDYNQFEFRDLGPQKLFAFSLADQQAGIVIENINDYKLSADGKSIIYMQSMNIQRMDFQARDRGKIIGIVKADSKNSPGTPLNTSDLRMFFEPRKEWRQIFNEAWRMERDFYYDPQMRGIDWAAIKKKFEKLLPNAAWRRDIHYIIGEMISDLNTSHTYVGDGDRHRNAERVSVGLLGADYEIDTAKNLYKFKTIFRVPDWSREVIPPLMGPGIDVKEGDYLLAVNDKDITADREIFSYFQDLAGKQVKLLINNNPSKTGAREITVKPTANEMRIRYQYWVERNRQIVEKESKGLIGYIHFPDTYENSAIEFPKYYYSQTQKKGIIIDGRFNGGGLDPDIFLGRLDKKIQSYWTRRYSHDQYTPHMATRAHFVCLTNLYAGSGGDEFPFVFKQRNMGPVVGTRTWGGLVGISMTINLIDGGTVTAPDYRVYNTQGNWVIENEGFTPDYIVDLAPAEVERGYDAQLMKGIELLLKKIKEDPRPWPQHQPIPQDKLEGTKLHN